MRIRRRRAARAAVWALGSLMAAATSAPASAAAAPGVRPSHPARPAAVAPVGTTGVAAGFRPDTVTAIGDSVMLDYASDLVWDLPRYHVSVDAAVSRQFVAGVALADSLRATHQLGAVVIVALGTNGPVTPADMAAMAHALAGASRIVFVTVHVDQPWQAEVNAEIRRAVPSIPHAVVADWVTLANHHPSWLYSDGTHLPINGTGAQALAALVAHAVSAPTPTHHDRRAPGSGRKTTSAGAAARRGAGH